MAVSIKTGDTESMNDPVSKTRLNEMYNHLKLELWIEIKDQLKSNKTSPTFARALVEKTFKDAAKEMKKKKQQIEEAFGLTGSSGGPTVPKVKEYKQLAVQNLQMALYHSSKDLLKSPFPKYEGEKTEDVMVNLRRLTSECYCQRPIPNPKAQGCDSLIHWGKPQYKTAELGVSKQTQPSLPPLSVGHSRVEESPAPLKETGSRAHSVCGDLL
ncbi:hypothetical protein CRENBAI_000292 [Crenichthys baileyi]|uniref:Uncharacterized protein n=1 Tax=Crenichthys baileyi TaxID=28760 RepID=A0AAV9RHG4_9TELE